MVDYSDYYCNAEILKLFNELESKIECIRGNQEKKINDVVLKIIDRYNRQIEYIQYLESHIEEIYKELSNRRK